MIKNSVTEYEAWKSKFEKQMKEQISDIINCHICITHADKWNIEFAVIDGQIFIDNIFKKLQENKALGDVLTNISNTESYNRDIYFRINAKTEEELSAKLMYLKLVF